MSVNSIYVEKKPGCAVEAGIVLSDLRGALMLSEVRGVRILNRYLVENITIEDFESCRDTVFSEPQVDITWDELPDFGGDRVFAVEYLPGQFDQRADSCEACISLTTGRARPTVRCARVIALDGKISDAAFSRIKSYLINPVESREASLEIPPTLDSGTSAPGGIEAVTGFIGMGESELDSLRSRLSLAMDLADLKFCRQYFRDDEKRDPTVTELRVIDTYWSDHCRHTTFLTRIVNTDIATGSIQEAYRRYLGLRERRYGDSDRPVTLMDMATIGAKSIEYPGMDVSDEINACTVSASIDVDGKPQDWLLMFKNETHNHPTEIEPFGGAATCLGGAIRDPLSGRGYVYQSMRITGAGNPLESVSETRPGKLPQRKICQTAASGFSSYGNQIGLATGLVHEIYHPGYVAKRLELGAVVGAAPAEWVRREKPQPGDAVILLGGRTGRDGCGGATGSSKPHSTASLEECGSEVQKGNAPEERKLQRLFRNPAATRLIKRCNDFGAGGVSVAVGELADGVRIKLDTIPKKYEGLDGTELAISESQERMAVVVSAGDADAFIALADAENLEATVIATVTREPRLVMDWQGESIVDISREFLSSNGAEKRVDIRIEEPAPLPEDDAPVSAHMLCEKLSGLNLCSQKGLVQRFDSTVGAGSVLLPFGGKYQLTPAQVMAALLPVPAGKTDACSLMSWAFDPERSALSPYHAAMEAVVESVSKIIAAGGNRGKCWLTFQEFFERLGSDPVKWGKPAAALLGALEAQMKLQIAAIGGKDSMSGTFEELGVPPTLVSIAVSLSRAGRVVSGEFKSPGSFVYLLAPRRKSDGLIDFEELLSIFDAVEKLTETKSVLSARALSSGGSAAAVSMMCFGNRLGFSALSPMDWKYRPGGIIVETAQPVPELESRLFGRTIEDYVLETGGERIDLEKVQAAWEGTLQPVYPYLTEQGGVSETFSYRRETPPRAPAIHVSKPLAAIPAFPGTNCEYDTARAVERAGGAAEILVVRNLTENHIAQSVDAFAKLLERSQMLIIPGGFSGGDEPEGSGKLITAFLRNPKLAHSVSALLARDGLICGICNGFQALIKLGLLPYGEIRAATPDSPTLTFNEIGRHQAGMVRVRVASDKSPWLSGLPVGSVYMSPVSHGEGRFTAGEDTVRALAANGQIATQYVDFNGTATRDIRYNPNGSDFAIEGVTSPDGRVFGKMAHCERSGEYLYRNMPPVEDTDIFRGAVEYFRG